MAVLAILQADARVAARLSGALSADHEVVVCSTWRLLRETLEERAFDGCLVDADHPGRDSAMREIARLRGRWPGLAIIACVEDEESQGYFDLGEVGVDGVISSGSLAERKRALDSGGRARDGQSRPYLTGAAGSIPEPCARGDGLGRRERRDRRQRRQARLGAGPHAAEPSSGPGGGRIPRADTGPVVGAPPLGSGAAQSRRPHGRGRRLLPGLRNRHLPRPCHEEADRPHSQRGLRARGHGAGARGALPRRSRERRPGSRG